MTNEPSPRPWRIGGSASGTMSCIHDANGEHIASCFGMPTEADAALIVDAVNERDRLRDIVRRLVRVAIRDRETLRYIYSDVEYATEDDDAIGDALREARAAIGEDNIHV